MDLNCCSPQEQKVGVRVLAIYSAGHCDRTKLPEGNNYGSELKYKGLPVTSF
jgi:hypothetical protein